MPTGEITPLTNRLVLRTTRGVSCILLLADSLNRFRHIMKHLLRISVFVVLLNRSYRRKEALCGTLPADFLRTTIFLLRGFLLLYTSSPGESGSTRVTAGIRSKSRSKLTISERLSFRIITA